MEQHDEIEHEQVVCWAEHAGEDADLVRWDGHADAGADVEGVVISSVVVRVWTDGVRGEHLTAFGNEALRGIARPGTGRLSAAPTMHA